MSLIPTFSARGAPSCLQPLYFASAVFVSDAREDIGKLLSDFNSVVYFSSQPFRTFKELWIRQGWHFAHMFITEAPTRDMYIKTMLRLLAGRCSYQSTPPYYADNVHRAYHSYSGRHKCWGPLWCLPILYLPNAQQGPASCSFSHSHPHG